MAVVGLLAVGLVGMGAVYAQGPNPPQTPQPACPMWPQGGMGMAPRRAGVGWGGSMLQTWADALGMKVEDLTAALQGGKTIAALAEEKGLQIEDLVEKAIAARRAALQQAVEAKRLTQEQADAMLQQMRTQMTQQLESGTCTPGVGRGRMSGGGCGRWSTDGTQQPTRPGGFGRGLRRGGPSQPA